MLTHNNLLNRQANISINLLPIEIFIKIISYAAGRPSIHRPYPGVTFSLVCTYWRLAILGNAMFWKTIVLGWRGISPTVFEELVRRSRGVPLDIIVKGIKPSDYYALVKPRFPSVVSRVKTLHLNLNLDPYINFPLSDLICFFPSLENVFFRSPKPAELALLPLHIQPQLQAMQIYLNRLGNLTIPGHFSQLRWLNLTFERVPLSSLLEALQNLPNLQHLYLFGPPGRSPYLDAGTENTKSVITLRELTALSSNCPILHLIDGPKLSYIDVYALYPSHSIVKDICGPLCGFDFSKITHIHCDMQVNSLRGGPCIIGRLIDKYEDFKEVNWGFGTDRYDSNRINWRRYRSFEWIFNESPATFCYPNQFYLSFAPKLGQVHSLITTLSLYLKKATNLVEITFGFELSSPDPFVIDSFSDALRSAPTVRSLTILSGPRSVQGICDLLGDGNLLPRLERLCFTVDYDYYEDEEVPPPSHILGSLRKLRERSLLHRRVLEIELKGFRPIQFRELEETERWIFTQEETGKDGFFNYFVYF